MPRPGPRPYECVRRAWHSDRHQPIRGSIIQQIFRAVHERHSVKTKKKREWQEKLPIVVLKAEEIMYSKANSEAEYMDLDTLWDRVNDAIDTIIRRDESTETGQLLPPCVEAALNLGCVPIRASRSQRLTNPRSYLGPRTQEPGSGSKVLGNDTNERNASSAYVHSATQSTSGRNTPPSSMHLASEFRSGAVPNISNCPRLSCEKVSSSANNRIFPADSGIPLDIGTVYPLYYGPDFQPEVQQLGRREPQKSNTIILGRPVFPSIVEPTEVGCLPGSFPCSEDKNMPYRIPQQNFRDKSTEAPGMECDLSLRLGLSSDSGLSTATASASGIGTAGPGYLQEGFVVSSLSRSKEFSFFPVTSANDPSGHQTRSWNLEGEGQFPEAVVRKRKMPVVNTENRQFFWQQGSNSNHFAGQTKRPVGSCFDTSIRLPETLSVHRLATVK